MADQNDDPIDRRESADQPNSQRQSDPSDADSNTADSPGGSIRTVETAVGDEALGGGPSETVQEMAKLYVEAWNDDEKRMGQDLPLLIAQNAGAKGSPVERAQEIARDEEPEFDPSQLISPGTITDAQRQGDDQNNGGQDQTPASDDPYANLDGVPPKESTDDSQGQSEERGQTSAASPAERDRQGGREHHAETEMSERSDQSQSVSSETENTESVTFEEADEKIPESRTLEETGLLTDDGEHPWMADATESEVGEFKSYEWTYKGTNLEIFEPVDEQRYENRLGMLEGIDRNSTERQRRKAQEFAHELAKDLLEVEGEELDDVYRVEVGPRVYVVPDPHGEYDFDGADTVETFWDGATWFDQMQIGRKISNVISGDVEFRRG